MHCGSTIDVNALKVEFQSHAPFLVNLVPVKSDGKPGWTRPRNSLHSNTRQLKKKKTHLYIALLKCNFNFFKISRDGEAIMKTTHCAVLKHHVNINMDTAGTGAVLMTD